MTYSFKFCPYQHHFCHPLKTSHGIWEVREGIIIRLVDAQDNIGWGEIAPLPSFGSETLAEAWDFCSQLSTKLTKEDIQSIPNTLPACQFGFESALEDLDTKFRIYRDVRFTFWKSEEILPINFSYLLPTGEFALQVCETFYQERQIKQEKSLDNLSEYLITFKWKIGVASIAEEMKIFEQLITLLTPDTKLRLDANGGLSLEEAKQWLEVVENTNIVEFIEQPLSPQKFEEMLELSANYSTILALDESVANLQQLEDCYHKGWQGIFVIKAAIAGSPQRLRQLCKTYKIDAVFSSVFETEIGRKASLKLAKELSNPNRAVGFGVDHWFQENDDDWLINLWKNS